MQQPQHNFSSRHVALAIISLAMGGFGIGTIEFAMMGLLPNVAQGVNVTIPEAGHLISAYALGVVVGAPILAAVAAKMPRKRVVIALMVLFTLGNFSSFLAQDFWYLLITRFISGLPHGAFFGVAAVLAASLVSPTKRGRAISMVMLGLSIANVVGVPLATFIGQQFGWRLLFILVTIIGAITVLCLWIFIPAQPAAEGASVRGELSALKRIQVWLALLIGIVGFGGFFAVYAYIAPTMTEVTGLPSDWLPLVVAIYGVGMVIGNVVGGRMADRSVMGSIYIMMGVIAAILLIFSIGVHQIWSALPLVLLIGASGAMLVPALQTRLLDVSPGAQSLASSMNHSALNIANALGAFLGGLVIAWGWGYVAPALVGAGLAILGLGIAAFSGRVDRRQKQPATQLP
ncbi:putative efflux protein [Renibacterium salmoninarum ATCC 33209]|uniref:Putative efflux protein n=1 Tax=Renibacterium salmoninarum (strain ATCC 33209 / DSM 20767 / JCM 11484 / NBRC 15589 / NCIMB 2235) TaxID=288705 RepID=A9WQB4_RENSM|nr:MFS transporter [Renibacterium salmoninarum]ABY22497.1 putative efflux protein [Renibacterium salmoninarum ATCC 33209]